MAKEGIVVSNGDDSQDSEDASDGREQNVDPDKCHRDLKVTVGPIPSRKGKEKVCTFGVSEGVTIFDSNVPETPEDPVSNLNPTVSRGKRPAESSPSSHRWSDQACFKGGSVCGLIG